VTLTGGRPTGSCLRRPRPPRLDLPLETGPDVVTRRLHVAAQGHRWVRRVELEVPHPACGRVELRHATTTRRGLLGRHGHGCEVRSIATCCSPLTNPTVVLRHQLPSALGVPTSAWRGVSVPLSLPSGDSSTSSCGTTTRRGVVGYLGRHRGFSGQLLFDPEGFVLLDPHLGRRQAVDPDDLCVATRNESRQISRRPK
jgi:hypothetical protein